MLLRKKIIFLILLGLFLFFLFVTKRSESLNIFYYNLNNNLAIESVDGEYFLNFLYRNNLGKIFRSLIIHKFLSKLVAYYADSSFSRYQIKSFIKKHNINKDEFVTKYENFKTFNDFFVRKIKKKSRPIDYNENIVISPADSKLFVIPDISKYVKFFIKNKKFNLNTFLQDNLLSEKYDGGQMLIFRLTPSDYHRYHFPFNCFAYKPKIIDGILESVNPIVYRSGIQPLYENERQIIELKSSMFGDVSLVVVGALLVGKIINTFKPNKEYKKGEEIGFFKFGGSTLVLLFEKDKIKVKDIFLKNSAQGYETEVKMGQSINY